MVNFRERLFPRSKSSDGRAASLPRSSSAGSKVKETPSSSRSYSSTRSFSILGRSPSPGPNSPSPTFKEQQQLASRTRNVSGTSTGTGGSRLSRSMSRSRSDSPTLAIPLQAHSRWDWKIEEPSVRADEIDYSEYKECHGCKKPIYQDMVQLEALTKLWHPECFHCATCAKILAPPEKFMELKGKPYCERDYNDLVYPKCYACSKNILDSEVRVLQKSYHPDCFSCRKCGVTLCPYTGNFLERNGSYYCMDDYHLMFSPRCYECDEPIRDARTMTRALGTTYHREHFVCTECKNPLPGNNIWRKNGDFYCEEDYHKLFSPVCAACFQPIRHNGIAALGRNWHGDCCLRCGACEKVLREDNYIAEKDKAYCPNDWVRLFGPKCSYCRRPIFEVLRGENVVAMGLDFHPPCFRCYQCMTVLNESNYYEYMGRPYCHEHYHAKTCVDCIKKGEHTKLARQQSIDRVFEDQIYGPGGKKSNRKDSPRPGSVAASASGASRPGFHDGRATSKQSLYRSRSISPIDYFFRSKSSQA